MTLRLKIRSLSVYTIIFLLSMMIPSFGAIQPVSVLDVGTFSKSKPNGSFPDGWEPLSFPEATQTDYVLVESDDTVVVKAISRSSASGLSRHVSIDPREHPILRWRWNVESFPSLSDFTHKEGDDYAARVYIGFEYDASKVGFFEKVKYELIKLYYGQYPPLNAISYIWDANAPVGTVAPSPYTDRVQMIVVNSGIGSFDQWVAEEQNVYNDYQAAFGETPPLISLIAIMTDTDDTAGSATAYFGDLMFRKGHE